MKDYHDQLGEEKYWKEYHKIYSNTVYNTKHHRRFSGMEYENSKEDLDRIKEKYKNGVTDEILKELFF